MEEWQSTDSGYLNCIGVGDTYVRKQIERILGENYLKADFISWWPCGEKDNGWMVDTTCPSFIPKEDNKVKNQSE